MTALSPIGHSIGGGDTTDFRVHGSIIKREGSARYVSGAAVLEDVHVRGGEPIAVVSREHVLQPGRNVPSNCRIPAQSDEMGEETVDTSNRISM